MRALTLICEKTKENDTSYNVLKRYSVTSQKHYVRKNSKTHEAQNIYLIRLF
jgi:hypothetical protein